jgi:hypothetical protein
VKLIETWLHATLTYFCIALQFPKFVLTTPGETNNVHKFSIKSSQLLKLNGLTDYSFNEHRRFKCTVGRNGQGQRTGKDFERIACSVLEDVPVLDVISTHK